MRFRTTTLMPAQFCSYCGHRLDAHSSISGGEPEPGSISVCGECAGLHEFDAQMRLRPVSDEALRGKVSLTTWAEIGEMRAKIMDRIKAYRV